MTKKITNDQREILKDLMICISQLKTIESPVWKSAVDSILEKLEGINFSHQQLYIESQLEELGLGNILYDFEALIDTYKKNWNANISAEYKHDKDQSNQSSNGLSGQVGIKYRFKK